VLFGFSFFFGNAEIFCRKVKYLVKNSSINGYYLRHSLKNSFFVGNYREIVLFITYLTIFCQKLTRFCAEKTIFNPFMRTKNHKSFL